VSTPNARYMTGDLKDIYLGTPMEYYEYVRIPCTVIPDSIMLKYKLAPLIHNGYVYGKVRCSMYGLPQAGRIANEQLTKFLVPHGYAPVPITPGLWRHTTCDIAFTLVVDDFGIKYTKCTNAEHLMQTLNKLYKVSEDWEGT
jgi:hypothetical protein